MPQWLFLRSPYVVTKVRWQLSPIPVSRLNAPTFSRRHAIVRYGAAHSDDPKHGKSIVDRFSQILPIVNSTPEIMERFGIEKARLASAGTSVEDADVLIAATALTGRCQIATGNIRHFNRFDGLEVLVW